MMHHSNVVVAITDNKGKAYREYDFKKIEPIVNGNYTKSATVMLPFDSEYAILIKNNNPVRIKVDIDIDGTTVTDRGVIIDANDKVYLERFVDVARKFKFVKKDSEEVADPTNVENGVLRVSVELEKEKPKKSVEIHHHHHHYPPPVETPPWSGCPGNTSPIWYGQNTVTSDSNNYLGFGGFVSQTKSAELSKGVLRGLSAPTPVQNDLSFSDLGEAGATVEGTESDQEFRTTKWLGSQYEILSFQFNMRGKTEKTLDPEYEKYLELKAKFE